MKQWLWVAGLLLCAACATTNAPDPQGDPYAARDPLEHLNQSVFAFNRITDTLIIKPIAKLYHTIPFYGRVGIANVTSNLSEPVRMLNGALQGDATSALTSLWRLILNSTVGIGGLRDFAGENGLPLQNQNFSATLAHYGVGEGSYLVLPLLGPSTARDKTGLIVDIITDPFFWLASTTQIIERAGAHALSLRDEESATIETLYYQSIDPYAATRAAYLQHRLFGAPHKPPK